MKKIENEKLVLCSAGYSSCAEAIGLSVGALILAACIVTEAAAVGAGVAAIRAGLSCRQSGWK